VPALPGVDPETLRALQERAAGAQPAEHLERVAGWWLRHSASSSWWVSTVLPHGEASSAELAALIAMAEAFYAGFGVPTRFQVTPGVCPAGLEQALVERGYCWDGLMSLRIASTAEVASRPQPRRAGTSVRLSDALTEPWFDVWSAVHGRGGFGAEWSMLARVAQRSAYAAVWEGGEVVAVGRAVAESGWAGVFGMATRPEARGRGAGLRVLASLADWARGQGAAGMYLQVERDNVAATRLYDRAGFNEACAYHYRTGWLSGCG
jgi:ribosomal protein S18 acetylase RimI-like enzyme